MFEGGTLTAECWLGPTVRLKKAEPGARAGQGAPRGPEPDAMGEPFKRGGGKLSPDEINEMYGKRDYEYVLPPRSALIVKFTNHDARPVTFTIADVNSVLGNFVPSPETLTLAPAQQGAIDPMLSNFDGNFDEVELTLTLKTAGVKETHILKLQRGPESPPREGSAAP